MNFLQRSVANKKIIWLKESNRYMLVEIPAYNVISRLVEGNSQEETVNWCSKYYDLPDVESKRFVAELQQLMNDHLIPRTNQFIPDQSISIPSGFSSLKFYEINSLIFSVTYENVDLEDMIHPKFAHLEIDSHNSVDHYFQVFTHSQQFALAVNSEIIGQWKPEDAHFLSGKFSMELVNRIYRKSESDWMAVFHASAVYRDNQCLMVAGDSGNGKSTLTALLMANGFDLLADDFVPVDADKGEVFYFPAAVSVKNKALRHLVPFFPQLETNAEFYFAGLDKTVRYLVPEQPFNHNTSSYPCKALIFVKYEKESGIELKEMSKEDAFSQLVPDSWISPIAENASRFLDWFLELPCYRLTYSENQKMVEEIEKIFTDEI